MGNLVLTRSRGESVKVVVGGKVVAEVTLVGLSNSGNECKLAFEAEPEVKFLRSEVWERMQKEGAK
jgi:sRNA-binding carbon storage regulator CsrA